MRVNRAPLHAWVALPAEMPEVLVCALDVQRLSAGAFDPCVGGMVNAWGFGAQGDAPDALAYASLAHRSRQWRKPVWSWTQAQAGFASERPCSSTCAALPKVLR